MAISSSATGLRPGVCTSTTRPTNPYIGQLIFETDTFKMQFWTGTAWQGAVSAPAGTVNPYAGSTAPTGWLLCFGQAVSRSQYADLFAVVGTTYGSGDGSTTFNIPDLRGRVAAGKDDMGGTAASRLTSTTITSGAATLGNSGGAQTHTLTEAQLASHTHTQDAHGHNLQYGGSLGSTTNGREIWGDWNGGGSGTAHIVPARTSGVAAVGNASYTTATTATNQNTGGGGAHNNVQPTIILNYIIKF